MNKLTILSSLVVSVSLFFSQAMLAKPEPMAKVKSLSEVITSPNDQRAYKAIRLENGIEVILVSDPQTEKSAAALSVGVGLMWDPMSQQGMAHYLEHMLFLGTERFPETDAYSKYMSENGGGSNAYTWLSETNYQFNINNDAFDGALDRFSEFFKAPKLYPEYTDKEKNAVNAEWSMRREMDFFSRFKLKRQLMADHPANRFLIGNLETLGDKEGSNLHKATVDFYNKFYSANIMKVAMLSNRSLPEMQQLAIKYFSTIENKNIEKPEVKKALAKGTVGGKRVYFKPNQDLKQLILDFTIKNNTEQFAVKPNNFISYLIGSEMPGTPAFILKEQGLISSLSTSAAPNQYGNYGDFTITINLTDAGMQQREKILATVMQYLELVKKQGVDSKYFSEIKTSLSNRFKFLEKTNEFGYVTSLAANMQLYPVEHVISAPYHYEKFDAKAINQVLEQLTVDNLLVWYISKEEQVDQTMHFYDGSYRIASITQDEVEQWSNSKTFAMTIPDVNRLLPESFELYTKAQQQQPMVAYDNQGIKIWQHASQHFSNQPKGVMSISLSNPSSQSDIKAKVLESIWASMYNLQQSALLTEASVAGMNLSVSADNGLSINISGFTDKQGLLLEQAMNKLVVDVTTENFSQAIDRYVRGINNAGKQFPYIQVLGKFGKLVNSGNYDDTDLVKVANSLKPKDLKVFMQKLLNRNNVRVFSFGNYADKDVAQVASLIKDLMPQDRQVVDFTKTQSILPKAGQTLVYQQDIEVEDVALLDLYVHPEPGFKQKARASILANHYRREAFNTLRTEEQLAYAVAGLTRSIDDYVAIGLLIQTPVLSVDQAQARFDRFNQEYIEKLNKITTEEFEKFKQATLVSLKEKPKNLSEEVQPLLQDWTKENFDFNSRAQLIAEVETVTLAEIKQFYMQTVASKDAARISLQLRGKKFADKPFAEIDNQLVVDDIANFHQKVNHQN